MYLYLHLRDVAIDVVKARVGQKDRLSATYTISVSNRVSHAQHVTTKTDADFNHLVADILVALKPGHTCSALCPWFHADIQQKLPKKSLFLAPTNKRVVASHLELYQALLTTIMSFCLHPSSRGCAFASDAITNAVVAFLFDGEVVEGLLDSPVLMTREDTRNNVRRTSNTCCVVCDRDLEMSMDSSLTTLSCGHTFHDDCILHALNKHLVCPSCPSQA